MPSPTPEIWTDIIANHQRIRDTFTQQAKLALENYINNCSYLNQCLRDGLNPEINAHRKEHPELCKRVKLKDDVFNHEGLIA